MLSLESIAAMFPTPLELISEIRQSKVSNRLIVQKWDTIMIIYFQVSVLGGVAICSQLVKVHQ